MFSSTIDYRFYQFLYRLNIGLYVNLIIRESLGTIELICINFFCRYKYGKQAFGYHSDSQ